MRKGILLACVILVIVASGASAQTIVAVNPGFPGYDWAEVKAEFMLGNWVSLGVTSGMRMTGGFAQAARLGTEFRVYPTHSRDLGFRGFPYDIRDLGHRFSPYIALGGGVSSVLPERVQDYEVSDLAFMTHIEGGLRWYPFRSFVVSRAHYLDDIFIEVPLGFEFNVSEATGVLDYNDENSDLLGREFFNFPFFYMGLWFGIIL